MLHKYISDPSHVLETPEIELRDDLSYEEQPVQILGREEKRLRNKTIALVKGEVPLDIFRDLSSGTSLGRITREVLGGSPGIPRNIGNLTILKEPYLGPKNLTDNFFTSLLDCKYLRLLELESNPLNAMLPNFGGNLSSSLQYFGVINCSMKGNIPKQIGSLSSLMTLKLDDNDLTGSIPPTIGGLQKLQGIYLNGNEVKGFIPSKICHLEGLVELFLANNKLVGSILECLGNLSSLRTLSLSSNGSNSTIPNTLWSLVYILTVNLSSNSLVGSLPLNVENLKVLIAIDLSNNELSGNIPSTIGSLQNLVNHSLAQNRFTGHIST
nr:probable leucine-rich repeat receptor-like protein kinase At1g35710 [Ziziphus jujuba var. spinosa]